jgi:hypothetical protein
MLACGTLSPILGKEEVGVVILVHLKSQPCKQYERQKNHFRRIEAEICIKANNSKEKAKTGWFGYDCPRAEHQKHGQLSQISIHYLYDSVRRMVLELWNSEDRLCCWILFWIEQRLIGTWLLGFGLAKNLAATNSITVGNSLSFPMVYIMAPNVRRFVSYGCQKLDWSAEIEI